MHGTLVLASTSPYRRALLARLQLSFEQENPRVDEAARPRELPRDRAQRLAAAKALAVAARRPGALVIGSDQVAALGTHVFDKPGTTAVAREQLRRCSAQWVDFHTAVALARNDRIVSDHTALTRVLFRPLSQSAVERYVELEPALDCAGSFRWEGLGISLFERLEGDDPTALEGLPLIGLCALLRAAGLDPLSAETGEPAQSPH